MRCSSTVSAPVQHCCAPLTAHHSRYIAVQLLTNQVLYFVAETKSKTKDVYTQTCIYLAEQGMLDCELFGLAIMYDGEYLFVDPESKLSKYAPKNWKSSSSHGLDGQGKPVFFLHFRVQFYVETPHIFRDDLTRHCYYLQLRDNALSRGHIAFCSSDELLLLLAGYALQADYGDYIEAKHKGTYFELEKYFPKETITKNSQITKMVISLHKDNRGLTAAEAEMQYIREASSDEITLLTHNLHLYKLQSHKKQHADQCIVWLAICAQGIQIYEENSFKKSLSTTFLWNNIGKLCFDRKKFEIKALSSSSEKMTYYTSSDEKSKHLLFLCRITHQFNMSMQSRLSEIRKKEEEERKKYKDSFVYEREIVPDYSPLGTLNRNSVHYKNMRSDQRISVISNTSSNTTSGIVSDRVQSLDESEDDIEIEIMIKRPPGNSAESLALAHLSDPSGEDENSCDGAVPKQDEDVNIVHDDMCVRKSSPLGVDSLTPATTDDSQCSSSCSTVVIAGIAAHSSGLSISSSSGGKLRKKCSRRRSSTTSSLELGYSHTTENSVLSDSMSCLELDLTVQNAQFTLSEKVGPENSETMTLYEFNSLPNIQNDLSSSNFIFSNQCKNMANSNYSRDGESVVSSASNDLVFANSNFNTANIYNRGTRSDAEGTRQTEIGYPDAVVSHISNASDDIETTSSGVYTNSNDVSSTRLYSSVDLEENAGSDIYTLPSATEDPDTQTNVCSSETSGIYGVINSLADTSSTSECYEVHSIRQRSGSNASRVSASGSFHGDGSDPSEAGKGSLLTAEELSDLIVGKTHKSGSYPSRSTVSNTLDSDSDYVTLPPPPRLPQRTDTNRVECADQHANSHSSLATRIQDRQNNEAFSGTSQNVPGVENSFLLGKEYIRGIEQFPGSSRSDSDSLIPEHGVTKESKTLGKLLTKATGSAFTLPEEANARFITTKPHISMITHSNGPAASLAPKYACPTHSNYYLPSSEGSKNIDSSALFSCPNKIQNLNEETTPLDSDFNANKSMPLTMPVSTPYGRNHAILTAGSAKQKKFSKKSVHGEAGTKMKLSSVSVLPVIAKNNYLDIHASKAKNVPSVPRITYHGGYSPLPPPPPSSPSMATVYTSQVTRSQIEQFKQQLYSDVDYVIYPMKDPAISKQEYMDAKQGSFIAALATGYSHLYTQPPPPPPPYPCTKTHVVYRSTPNVAVGNNYFPVSFTNQPVQKYSSNTHLNQSSEQIFGYQTYLPQPSHYSSTSPLYSPASYSSSSSQSLRYESAPMTEYFLPHPLSSIPGNSLNFPRTKSDDNILSSYQKPVECFVQTKCRRFPPPPPPFPRQMFHDGHSKIRDVLVASNDGTQKPTPERCDLAEVTNNESNVDFKNLQKKELTPSVRGKKLVSENGKIIDIHALIEQSKNLDLPLISALCNDKSLLRQTNAFVMPKHPGVSQCSTSHGLKNSKAASKKDFEKEGPDSPTCTDSSTSLTPAGKVKKGVNEAEDAQSARATNTGKTRRNSTILEALFSVKNSKRCPSSSSKLKYPVSGLSTTQIAKPQKKLPSAHVHPTSAPSEDGNIVAAMKTQIKTVCAIKNKNALVP